MPSYEITRFELMRGFRLNVADATVRITDGTRESFNSAQGRDDDSIVLAAVKATLLACGEPAKMLIKDELGEVKGVKLMRGEDLLYERSFENGDLRNDSIAREVARGLVAAI